MGIMRKEFQNLNLYPILYNREPCWIHGPLKSELWSRPVGMLKFNVDEVVAKGAPANRWCSYNDKSETLLMFSKSTGVKDSD